MNKIAKTTNIAGSATNAYATDAARWAAVQARDAGADGKFYYAVRTTGVYCRPSCGSRAARRENMAFYDNCADAIAAGFRPCKRCTPNQAALSEQHAGAVAQACRLIETAEQLPGLQQLADAVGMSRYHFHRVFKAIAGVTPKAYAAAHRGKRVREELARTGTVTQAIYDAGFNSNGRFYASSTQVLGMTPGRFRAGGVDTEIRFALGECSLGSILVASTAQGVCSILLGDDPDALIAELQDSFPRASLVGGDAGFEQLVSRVVGFVEAPALGLDLPLDVRGTAFQQRVWQALRDIPAGCTVSYSDIAARIGSPKAMRAVAQACAANKIAVAIPCHRVVRNDGALSGYRWGVERKRSLLDKETAGLESA
ncbi:bifunctional DNA-binding transcriptional regulator/O6-methylguanine-DNA methyltransferase Ada [Undibacterium sp.]|uniref:bifunctional DNA-binding transcriptional regulator/O6-methylguanine-DNA methyltransferase Ada n=1 Tax=Undibacterium sp. TaxID=1914977 RepID=UPI002D0CE73F|nr:bifunctional DNA-binding transcriptional regulator/O6-methylguanine-DNA methyltransferase Ada [Undibacterium sp.]HTD06748.1 bifunctional DNA-binding transcriptional regulator/O6-methylguanine-DNA methyltransferase Ada [Undibacterium sp.]